MLPVRYDAIRIGGSHAQRDIVNLTLIAAAERGGQWSLARALLAERVAERPTSRTRPAYERRGPWPPQGGRFIDLVGRDAEAGLDEKLLSRKLDPISR